MAKTAEQITDESAQIQERQIAIETPFSNGIARRLRPRQRAETDPARTLQPSNGRLSGVYPTSLRSEEAEKNLLCSMMADGGVVIPKIGGRISPAHFCNPVHRTICQAILDNFEQVEAIDFSTVTQHLMQAGQIESVGGAAYVTQIGTIFFTSANYEYYLEAVQNTYALRQLIADTTEIKRLAHEPAADAPALVDLVQACASRFTALIAPKKGGLTVRTPNELTRMAFDDTDNYFGDRILAAGQPCTLLGPGGVGKSRLSLLLSVCMIIGRDFIGMPTRAKNMKWLFIQTENSNRRLHHDLNNIVSALALTLDERACLDRYLFIHTIENDGDCFLNLLNAENYAAVNRLVQEVQPDFVVWDPLNTFTDNDLNSDVDMRAVVSAISCITRSGNPNRVSLLLHHSLTGKAGAARAVGWDKASYGRNSKALHAWARAQINLAPRSGDDPNLLIMSCGKNNNGRLFPDLGLRFDEQLGIYVKDDSFDPEEFRQELGINTSKRMAVTVEEVVELCEDGITKPELVGRIKAEHGIQQRAAYDAINRAALAGRIEKDNNNSWPSTYSVVRSEREDYDN